MNIIELAKQAELIQWDTLPSGAVTPNHESVANARKFAALVRAAALEEAAGVCEERVSYWQRDDNRRDEDESCAAAIRALKESRNEHYRTGA